MTRSEQLVSAVHQAQFPHLNSLIHLFVGTSELPGAKVKDTDDLDIYGVYLEPPELVLGLDQRSPATTGLPPRARGATPKAGGPTQGEFRGTR